MEKLPGLFSDEKGDRTGDAKVVIFSEKEISEHSPWRWIRLIIYVNCAIIFKRKGFFSA